MVRISIGMITKNEESCLATCLDSVRGLADEIIIADTGSTDKTKQIAQRFGAKVIDVPWKNNFSAARNESLKHATGDWIFVIDADETIARQDIQKIRDLLGKAEAESMDGFVFDQRNYTNDSQLFGWRPSDVDRYKEASKAKGYFVQYIVRLFRNRPHIRFSNRVHEEVDPSIRANGGKIAYAGIPIHHEGYLRGDAKLEEKRKKYLEMGKKEIEEKPHDPKPMYEVAKIYAHMGKTEEAMDLFKKVIALDPNYKIPFTNLGQLHSLLGNHAEAEAAYKKQIELKPNNEYAYTNLGAMYARQKNYSQAMYFFKKAVILNPTNPSTLHNIFLLLLAQEKYDKALRILDQAFRATGLSRFQILADDLKKKIEKTPYHLAMLTKQGKVDDAVEWVQQQLKNDPKNKVHLTNLSQLCIKKGDHHAAMNALQKLIDFHEEANDALVMNAFANLAVLHQRNRQLDKAKSTLQSALERKPAHPEFFDAQLAKLADLRKK